MFQFLYDLHDTNVDSQWYYYWQSVILLMVVHDTNSGSKGYYSSQSLILRVLCSVGQSPPQKKHIYCATVQQFPCSGGPTVLTLGVRLTFDCLVAEEDTLGIGSDQIISKAGIKNTKSLKR